MSALLVQFHNIQALSTIPTFPPRRLSLTLPLSKFRFDSATTNQEKSITSLFSMNNDDHEGSEPKQEIQDEDISQAQNDDLGQDKFFIQEPRLLVGDLVSILLSCQLLGLVDILDTPEFWTKGGFAQPIDLSPEGVSTLGTLVKRDSVMSIAWVLSSIKNNGYSIGTVIDDITAIKCALTIFIDFCSLLIIFALTFAFTSNAPVDAVEILRESYYTILVLGAFRVVFGRLGV